MHDADKLDAIGAIGIARAFATGAHFKEVINDPAIAVPTYTSVEEYRKAKGTQGRTVINHFYEKLLLLKDAQAIQDLLLPLEQQAIARRAVDHLVKSLWALAESPHAMLH